MTGKKLKNIYIRTIVSTFQKSRVLRKCSNKFDCLIFEMFFIRDLKPKLNKVIPSAQSCLLNTCNSFHSLHLLFTLRFRILLFLLFVFIYLAFYLSFHCFRNGIYAEFFIHEVELENDRGAIETSFLFLSLVFITKCTSICYL